MTNKIPEISPAEAQQKISSGALLVDVRESDELEQLAYDVPKIVHLPISEFEQRYQELPKDQELVMVCRSGGRSLKAANFLLNHGFNQVCNLQHGIVHWAQTGQPTIGDPNTVLKR
jgi:rhodanese-related sulfurtransferase